MRILAFSGLGSNAQDFQYLQLEGIEIVTAKRIPPLEKEDVRAYCRRLLDAHRFQEADFHAIMGFSFGGILAQAVAAEWTTTPLILISTFTSKQEIPPLSRRKFWGNLASIAPKSSVPALLGIGNLVFGKKSTKTMRYILETTSERYLRWAMHILSHFDGIKAYRFANTYRIMAINDPFILHQACGPNIHRLSGGGHFILKTRTAEIEEFIASNLNV